VARGHLKRFLRHFWKALTLGVGLALFAYLVAKLGLGTIVAYLRRIGPGFFVMPAAAILGLCVRGLAILPLMPRGRRMSLGAAIASRLAATSLNVIIPVFGVGGEAVRLLWVPYEQRAPAVAAIILDRALLIVADLAFLLIALIAGVVELALPPQLEWIAIGGAVGTIGVAALLVWITANRGISVPLVKALRSVGFKSMGKKVPSAEAVDATMHSLWKERPRSVLGAAAIQFASRLVLAGELWAGLWLLGVPSSPLKALIVSAGPIGVNALFTFIPSQLGVQEAGIGLVFGLLHLGTRTGLVLGIIQRISQLIQIPVGLAALATAKVRRRNQGG
jgi:uncharacterized membrane protein YbhN (UPF0104 family)